MHFHHDNDVFFFTPQGAAEDIQVNLKRPESTVCENKQLLEIGFSNSHTKIVTKLHPAQKAKDFY